MTELKSDAAAITAFLDEQFPQVRQFGARIVRVDEEGVEVELETRDDHLRPGGTISGPTLMTLADTAMYLSLLSRRGPTFDTVTTSLEMHFLRRPRPGTLRASCRLLKVGRRVAVGTVEVRTLGASSPLAFATVTYAMPPEDPAP